MEICFGPDQARSALTNLHRLGSRAILVCGKDPQRHPDVVEQIHREAETVLYIKVSGEPDTVQVENGARRARDERCDLVIALGGGSVIDTGKAIAALVHNGGPLSQYLEVIGQGRSMENPAIPCIAIPTTAGTGAEATRNAVLTSTEHRIKVSLRSPHLLPRLAVIDPNLTLSLPPALTAATGMDALTQLIEAFLSRKANPMTDILCREGIRRAVEALPLVFKDGSNRQARADMAIASLYSGLALANGGLGAVHGIAGPLGGRKPVPHGLACAALLAPVYEANARLLAHSQSNGPDLVRFMETSRLLTGNPQATVSDGSRWLYALQRRLNLPALNQFDLTESDLAIVADKALNSSSMHGNPLRLKKPEVIQILYKAMEPDL
jgi:alcohol dehydrogenase class IV